jgi:hypothetical protein
MDLLANYPAGYNVLPGILPHILPIYTMAVCAGIFKQSMGARNRVGKG